MSYILDALRKSDQQRRRGAAPTLLAAQASVAEAKQPAFLSYGLLALVLVGAGMAIGWLRPWQPEQETPAVQAVAPKPPEPSPRAAAPAGSEEPEMARTAQPERRLKRPTPVAEPAPAPASVKPQTPARAKTKARSAPPKAPAALADEAASVPEEPAVSAAADVAPALVSIAELPASVQQQLPAMTISVHAYSGRPEDRMVGINDRMLREGEYVAPGLKLEEITPDGMIFSYMGYNFHRGVK